MYTSTALRAAEMEYQRILSVFLIVGCGPTLDIMELAAYAAKDTYDRFQK